MTTTDRRRSIRPRRVLRALGPVLLAIGASGVLVSGSAAQESEAVFTLTADAQVASVQVSAPTANLVVGQELANAAPARANVQFDSLGTSTAYAAAGYPGDTLIALPSTAIGIASGLEGVRDLVPLLPPIPAYPLIAQSDAINPSVLNQAGAYTLAADTSGGASTADALVGAAESGLTAASLHARAVATEIDGVATADALAEINGLRIGDLLDVSQRTTGTISATPGGQPQISTNSFFGVSLLGSSLQLGFGPEGLELLGTNVLDQVVLNSLLASLSNEQISIEYVPETRAEDGSSVTSAGLRVTQVVDTGPDIGEVIITYTLGQVTLGASASTLPTTPFGSPGSPGSPGTSGSGGTPGGGGTSSSGSAPAPRPLPSSPPVAPSAPTAVGAAPVGTVGAAPTLLPVLTLSSSSFYLALVAAGVCALLSSRLLGLIGIRHRMG